MARARPRPLVFPRAPLPQQQSHDLSLRLVTSCSTVVFPAGENNGSALISGDNSAAVIQILTVGTGR